MFPGNYFGRRFYARSYFVDVALDPVTPPGPLPPWAIGGFGGGAGGAAPKRSPEIPDAETFLLPIMAETPIRIAIEGPVFVVRPVFIVVANENPIFIEMEKPISPPHK
jgi:hypothetical protein